MQQGDQLSQLGLACKRNKSQYKQIYDCVYCNNYTGLCLRKIQKLLGNVMTSTDKSELAFH